MMSNCAQTSTNDLSVKDGVGSVVDCVHVVFQGREMNLYEH